MADNDKIAILESELKLIKGEMKESLVNVRDFLLTLKLPASAGVINLGPDEESLLNLGGGLSMDSGKKRQSAVLPGIVAPEESPVEKRNSVEIPSDPTPFREAAAEATKVRDIASEAPQFREAPAEVTRVVDVSDEASRFVEPPPQAPQAEKAETPVPPAVSVPYEQDAPRARGAEFEETPKRNNEDRMIEQFQNTPQVNMLANLLRWVSAAKRKIGIEQLPIFLEVYGICGNLSPDLKEVVLHLSDLAEQQSEDMGIADVWSQLILELHGILTGGGTPIQPLNPFWNGGEDEVDMDEMALGLDNTDGESAMDRYDEPVSPRENKRAKLKLIVPIGDGVEKEVDIGEMDMNLVYGDDGEGSSDDFDNA